MDDSKATTRGIVKPSTREFFRIARQIPEVTLWDALHGYVYARWPYLYIGIAIGEHPLAKVWLKLSGILSIVTGKNGRSDNTRTRGEDLPSDAETKSGMGFAHGYHGKVMPLEPAKKLVQINEDISLPDLEQIIPYDRARAIILRNPDHIVVLECPCRASRPDPCLPLDVCLIVGEPFAGMVRDHHPNRSRWISQQEAVEILEATDSRGNVHHAFFKDAMLGRFYAICNCCSCCCGAMQGHRNNTPMLASSGYVAVVDDDACIGCTTCADFCQFGALTIEGDKAVVEYEKCMGCGVCVNHCPEEGIHLQLAPDKGIPLIVSELMASAIEDQKI